MESQDERRESSPPKSDRGFSLTYIGWCSLDRRTTLPMLPWLVAEIRRRGERGDCGPVVQPREVQLVLNSPFVRCVPSSSNNSSVFIFEHKAQLISRFIHNSNDLSYFAYLLRGQPDNPESEMSCHVFKACDPNQVRSGQARCQAHTCTHAYMHSATRKRSDLHLHRIVDLGLSQCNILGLID